jgi:arylsulfatase A-like enzyme
MSDDPRQPYAGFGGTTGRVFATSTPAWPGHPDGPHHRPGAPNVIVVLCDDLGFADVGCFGSEIPTPHIDALAADGLRYTNFHVTPMCSPTRASLLTGLNSHMAGVGHVAHSDPGFPGHAMELRDNAPTIAEAFRAAGWATLMVGKWHLCKDSHLSEVGPRDSWPLQRGFDRYYGFLDGFTNFHQPHRLYEDNHVVEVDRYPDDYYFTDDITDRAIGMVRSVRSSHPTKPFFLYFAHGAVHAPLQAPADDIAAQRGRYDQGWDAVREARFARQADLGVVPREAVLAPRNSEERHAVPAWDELGADERRLMARYQEIFAAMVTTVDRNLGRLRAALEELGEWDNTIVVFTSDNGGSREGEDHGTSAYFRTLVGHNRPDAGLESFEIDASRIDDLGSPRTLPHYPMGWGMASNTPFRLYKVNTHEGGHHVPCIVSWPAGLDASAAGTLRHQYQHVTDLLPTLAELAGVAVLDSRHGVPAPPPAGASFAASLADPGAPSTHGEQLYEMMGHRGYYREGWTASTVHQPRTAFSDDRWELHNLDDDPTQTVDHADDEPERLAEMVAAWDKAAWENQVFPLDEGTGLRWIERPPWNRHLSEPVRILPGTPTLERFRSAALINARSFRVEIEVATTDGDEGVLVAHGDQGGGYAVYVEDGTICFAYNGYGETTVLRCGPVPVGPSRIVLAMEAPGNLRWHATVSVDGSTRAEQRDLVMLTAIAPFEGIDVGIDRRSPVSWAVYERHGPFPFTGEIKAVTYVPGELAPDAGERWIDFLRESGARFE